MVEARLLGTAFGICTTFQNLGTLVAPPILGWIQVQTEDYQYGYGWVEIFFIIVSGLAFVFNCIVNLYDKKKRGDILNALAPLEEFERFTQLNRNTMK